MTPRFLGNSLENYLWFAGILLVVFLLKRFLSKILSRLLYRFLGRYSGGIPFDQFLALLSRPFGFLLLLIAGYIACLHLEWPDRSRLLGINAVLLKSVLYKSYQVTLTVSVTWIFLRLTDFFGLILARKAALTASKADDMLVPFIKEAIKIIIGIFGLFFILSHIFEVNITSLIAGLGIGGLAIALAAKESLENLLGSFTIFFDKPFVAGDVVKVGNVTGQVEKIGFRSTRLRTPDKSYLTVPNKKMVDAELENLTHRHMRRAKFTIGLTYGTSPDQLRKIISEIKNTLKEHPKIYPEFTVRFMEFGNSSLDIMVEFLVTTADWNEFLEIREENNYRIMEIVKHHGSDFAFPTRTVHLKQ